MNLTKHFRAIEIAYDDVKKREIRDVECLLDLAEVRLSLAKIKEDKQPHSLLQLTQAAAAIIRAMVLTQIVMEANCRR